MLFTITTCLHLPGKTQLTRSCLDTLFSVETAWDVVTRFVLINEYDPDEGDHISPFKDAYPCLECIQKPRAKTGQAHSINMIIDILRSSSYTYWLHWEESWIPQGPFIRDALRALDAYPDIAQIQIAKGWDNVPFDVREGVHVVSDMYHARVDADLGSAANAWKWKNKAWPLFSLQPGIDRVEYIVRVGYFDPRHNSVPHGKVNGAEFNFAHRWYLQGVRKGVLTPYRALRHAGHMTTSVFIR